MISDENPFLAMGDWPQARKIRLGAAGIFTLNGRCCGGYGYAADVRFAPNSGHWRGYRRMSAYDPKRTFETSTIGGGGTGYSKRKPAREQAGRLRMFKDMADAVT